MGLIFYDSSKNHILLLFVFYLIKLASLFLHQILDFAPEPAHLVILAALSPTFLFHYTVALDSSSKARYVQYMYVAKVTV